MQNVKIKKSYFRLFFLHHSNKLNIDRISLLLHIDQVIGCCSRCVVCCSCSDVWLTVVYLYSSSQRREHARRARARSLCNFTNRRVRYYINNIYWKGHVRLYNRRHDTIQYNTKNLPDTVQSSHVYITDYTPYTIFDTLKTVLCVVE